MNRIDVLEIVFDVQKITSYSPAMPTSPRHMHAVGDLQVLATRTVTYGPRSFAALAPSSGTAFQPHCDTRVDTDVDSIVDGEKLILFCLAYGSVS